MIVSPARPGRPVAGRRRQRDRWRPAGGGPGRAAAARTWRYLADALRLQAADHGRGPGARFAPDPGRPPGRCRGAASGRRRRGRPGVVEAYGLRQRLGYLTLSVDALLSEPRRPSGPGGEPLPCQRRRSGLRGGKGPGRGRARHARRRGGDLLERSGSSTPTAAPSWARAGAAWPSASGFGPTIAPSETPTSPPCASGRSTRSWPPTGRSYGRERGGPASTAGTRLAAWNWKGRGTFGTWAVTEVETAGRCAGGDSSEPMGWTG